ncbi:LysR family transcriptional regulator [Neptunomonas antarctica]|uniref:Transcriptional regulator n=1 Tax=Neptunomonas antarctica TaxID=619304 RepID=A0A1N7JXY6_9GAMM|nr:LysR family transcriptional regulator [Neptunomonas antarctica]SIS54187.1 transcriptional regulator [Neptunomonas antarctica]
MELLGLATFRAVVDEGGVLAASKILHTVQSNVTTRIKRLEEEVGADLFVRSGRSLSLTPAGRVLLKYARQMLQLERQARLAVKQVMDQGGEVRIGTMESFAAIRLPYMLLRLHQACPSIEVKVQTDTSHALIQAVLKHELDCAFIGGPFDHPDLVTQAVAYEELVAVKSKVIQRSDTLIVFREGCTYRERALQWQRQHVSQFDVMEMGTLEGILGCVAFGLGVTLMPRSVIEQSQYRDRLVCVELVSELAIIPTLLIRHKNLPILPGMDVLAEAFIDTAVQPCL